MTQNIVRFRIEKMGQYPDSFQGCRWYAIRTDTGFRLPFATRKLARIFAKAYSRAVQSHYRERE